MVFSPIRQSLHLRVRGPFSLQINDIKRAVDCADGVEAIMVRSTPIRSASYGAIEMESKDFLCQLTLIPRTTRTQLAKNRADRRGGGGIGIENKRSDARRVGICENQRRFTTSEGDSAIRNSD